MPAATDWKRDFGVDREARGRFFPDAEAIDAATDVSQRHALRRAFEQLDLDGILCDDRSPAVYFKVVDHLKPDLVADLHKRFWNHGIAPILVLIAPDEIQVYSGFQRPQSPDTGLTHSSGLVSTLKRVADDLQTFLISVTSGEFFRRHAPSFDPKQRVDRDLLRKLKAARLELGKVSGETEKLTADALDALLCRLIFTCYLFDRSVIDASYLTDLRIEGCEHLRDVLHQSSRTKAKADLYRLFEKLGEDFNGDLFSENLAAESRRVSAKHIELLDQFFRGTDVVSGQGSFWPYDFRIIPIETISSIYEHFLKAADAKAKKKAGAFYTPRFLAELVLDTTLSAVPSLLEKTYLDPACGSGIFLVGLFHRLADEWASKNPRARYDRRANELIRILRENIFGVDRNLTACRITAFSLYLAFLDQLNPTDIRELQRKGKVLPNLVYDPATHEPDQPVGTICHLDFFDDNSAIPAEVDFVIGNPPWGSETNKNAPVAVWCGERKLPFPDKQVVTGFIWKAAQHVRSDGRVALVLPHGTLFNHSASAVEFQKAWFERASIEFVLNLADFQRFMFEESEAPALVVRFNATARKSPDVRAEYLAPKTDWNVTQAEILSVLPQDRSRIRVADVLTDLTQTDAPQIWKRRFWATPRDGRLLERFELLPRLRDITGQAGKAKKRWFIAEGFQPLGENDDPEKARTLALPSDRFIAARSKQMALFLTEDDCETLGSSQVCVRNRSNKSTTQYLGPHVLITKGLKRIAFVAFDVSFRHAVRGIHGPSEDEPLLAFLAAFLRSKLARYFLFHTSSNWGVTRAEVHVDELLRLPFPLPDDTSNPDLAWNIVRSVAKLVRDTTKKAQAALVDREGLVRKTQAAAEKLIEEYFDIDPIERQLIADTNRIIIPSARPTRKKIEVPTIRPSTPEQRANYVKWLCETLDGFARHGKYQLHATTLVSADLGIGVVVLEKTLRGQPARKLPDEGTQVLPLLRRLETIAAKSLGSIQIVRGVKLFHENLLYVVKPIGQRFWTATAALNDADEIATTILMRSSREEA